MKLLLSVIADVEVVLEWECPPFDPMLIVANPCECLSIIEEFNVPWVLTATELKVVVESSNVVEDKTVVSKETDGFNAEYVVWEIEVFVITLKPAFVEEPMTSLELTKSECVFEYFKATDVFENVSVSIPSN